MDQTCGNSKFGWTVASIAYAEVEASIEQLLREGEVLLCLGYALALDEGHLAPRLVPARLDLLPGTWLFSAVTGGVHNHERVAFGVVARLPRESDLARLAKSYWGRSLPGRRVDETSIEERRDYRRSVSRIGFEVALAETRDLAEAWLPLGFDSACRYVVTQRIDIATQVGVEQWHRDWQCWRTVATFEPYEALPLADGLDLRARVDRAWSILEPQLEDRIRREDGPLGIVIVENSD